MITAGTAIREAVDIIKAEQAEPVGVLIALDRQEKGQGDKSAVQEVEADFGIQVSNIVTMKNLISFLTEDGSQENMLRLMMDYREKYGI